MNEQDEIMTMVKGEWYPLPIHGYIHECCRCGDAHDVRLRIRKKGKRRFIQMQWKKL